MCEVRRCKASMQYELVPGTLHIASTGLCRVNAYWPIILAMQHSTMPVQYRKTTMQHDPIYIGLHNAHTMSYSVHTIPHNAPAHLVPDARSPNYNPLPAQSLGNACHSCLALVLTWVVQNILRETSLQCDLGP